MESFIIVNKGIEETAKEEIKELISFDSDKIKINDSILEFSATKEELIKLYFKSQATKKLVVMINKFKDIDQLNFDEIDFNWKDFLSSDLSFKVEVLNVKGNDNRLNIAKKIVGKTFAILEKENIKPKVDLRNPHVKLLVYFTGEEYYLGVDFCNKELNARYYRVFTSPSSFKGDMGYFFVKKVNPKPTDKILIGFMKDGVIAIETALYLNKLSIQKSKLKELSFLKFPIFKDFTVEDLDNIIEPKYNLNNDEEKEDNKKEINIFAFDETIQKLIAARKNSILAKTKNLIEMQKYKLDELDVKYSEKSFDKIILQVTTKDEEKINELYYQTSYLIKNGGLMLLIGRKNFNPSISSKFDLIESGKITKGDCYHHYWLLKRK